MITDKDLVSRVRRISAERDWQLLTSPTLGVSGEDFAVRVWARLQNWLFVRGHAQITEDLIANAVINEYCLLLHAVVAHRNTPAGERALIEIWNYVTPMIRKILRDDDRAQDVAMDVLLKICDKRDQVRDAGNFLAWAGVIAYREAIRAAKAYPREVVMTDLAGNDDNGDIEALEALLADHASGSSGRDPGEDVRTAELEARIRECLRRMRRAADVFIGLVLRDLSVAEIAQRLTMKPAAVYVVFHRARKRLQKCGQLLADLGVDLGVKPCA